MLLLRAAAAQGAGGGTASLQATSATIAEAGDFGHICVSIVTNGNDVAGTQNTFHWDPNCASAPDPPRCSQTGSHGKQVIPQQNLQNADSFKVLVLALDNVEPIPDGPLYCCDFEGEADAGQCCPITMSDTSASDPHGNPIGLVGSAAQICTAAGSDQPARDFGSMGAGQPLSASNAPPAGQTGGGTGLPPPAAAPAGGGAPAAQVLPGGGVRVESTPAAVAAPPTVPALRLPTPPAPPAPPARPTGGSAPQPALPPNAAASAPTSAPTPATSAPPPAPTSPPPPDTPTAAATAVPTRAAPAAKQDQALPIAKAEKGGGWFGCQVAAGASALPVLGLGLLCGIGALARRRSNGRRWRDPKARR